MDVRPLIAGCLLLQIAAAACAAPVAIENAGFEALVDAADYDIWKMDYGQTASLGSGGLAVSAPLPEPTTCLLAIFAGFWPAAIHRRRRRTIR